MSVHAPEDPDGGRPGAPDARTFARAFFEQHEPVASICHGPWLLIDAGVIGGRSVTSRHMLATDLRNAGAVWSDEEVVVDQGLVTGRTPDGLEAFDAELRPSPA